METTNCLKEKGGKFSVMRIVHILGSFLILVIWAKLSITNGKIEPLDSNITYIFMSLQGAKVFQRYVEGKDTKTVAP